MWRMAAAGGVGAVIWIVITAGVVSALADLGVWQSTHGIAGLIAGFLGSILGFMIAAAIIERMLAPRQSAVAMYALVLAATLPMLVSLLVPEVRYAHLWTVLGVIGSCVLAWGMIGIRIRYRAT